jgi:hypothetical protein
MYINDRHKMGVLCIVIGSYLYGAKYNIRERELKKVKKKIRR